MHIVNFKHQHGNTSIFENSHNSFYKFVKKISDKIPGDKIINTDWNGNNHHVVPGFDPTVGCNPKPDAAVFGSP